MYRLFLFFKKEDYVKTLVFHIFDVEVNMQSELLYFFYGKKNLASGVAFPEIYERHLSGVDVITFADLYGFAKERYMDYYLFQLSNHGEFYYDDFSELLEIRRFRHSTLLEII